MKLAEYVGGFLASEGIRHVFAVSGGASLHLIHGIDNTPGIDFVCPHHEQAGAMAADAYARVTGNLGAAVATSGPGGTNMLTGIACAYYDSVPVIFITGQVATYRNKADTGVRQLGFQETEIVEMCRPITKYAVTVSDPRRIRYELEKAAWIAREGRRGPVLIDIPDDLQRAQVDPDELDGFTPPRPDETVDDDLLERRAQTCAEMIRAAERPVVIFGWGVRLSGAAREAVALVTRLELPVLTTWGVVDLLAEDHPLKVGTFGTHGTRQGNFTVQNADLVISIGSRLDTHGVGSPFSDFARAAKKVLVDIDQTEIDKFERYEMRVDLPVVSDARRFLQALDTATHDAAPLDISPWLEQIGRWKTQYPTVRPEYYAESRLNPYVFVDQLAKASENGEVIFVDTGCAVAWMSQAFAFKAGQRYFHAFNNTPMGYALPGAIGASLALDGKSVICVAGDGGLQMNVQELATAAHHRLPIKLFVLNNHGYSMIKQTQEQWLGSRYLASSHSGGLGFPDFEALGRAYGWQTCTLRTNADAQARIAEILAADGPILCNVELDPDARVLPQVKYGRPIEDSEPLLPREEFFANMLIEPVEASRAQ